MDKATADEHDPASRNVASIERVLTEHAERPAWASAGRRYELGTDRQRYIWLTVRKALLMVVAAIEKVYGKEDAPRWEP